MDKLTKPLIRLLALTVLLFLASSALAQGGEDTLNVGLYMEPQTQDPHAIVSPQDMALAEMVYEGLVEQEVGGVALEPRLAEDWEVLEDGLLYRFNLRPDVVFHDGAVLDAEAVKANFERMQELGLGYSWVLDYVEEIVVQDQHTIDLRLAEPFAPFLRGLTFVKIMSPAALQEHDTAEDVNGVRWFGRNAVGTGPYRLTLWDGGSRLEFEKFDDYWGGWDRPHVSQIHALVIGEPATQRLMLERGDLDIAQVFTLDAFQQIADDESSDIEALASPSAIPMRVRFNMVAGPTSDIRVRKAISYAFNRDLYEALMGGFTPWSDGPVAAELLGDWTPEGVILEHDPERARELFAEAGYADGLQLNYLYNEGDVQKQIIGEVLQESLRELGVDLEITVMTWPALVNQLDTWGDERDPATADNMYGQYVSLRIPEAWSPLFFEYYSKDGLRYNMMYYENPEVDQLIEAAMTETDEAARNEIYREAVQLIVDDVPDLHVDHIVDRVLIRDVVEGFSFSPTSLRRIPYANLYKTAP